MENGPLGCLQTATNVIHLLLPSSCYFPATLPCVLMWPNSSQFNTICTSQRACANLKRSVRASSKVSLLADGLSPVLAKRFHFVPAKNGKTFIWKPWLLLQRPGVPPLLCVHVGPAQLSI